MKVFHLERVLNGVSTYVYRVQKEEEILYARILPEIGMSFGVEAHVHSILRHRQVIVPEVIYFAPRQESLDMSLMIVREIAGAPIRACTSEAEYEPAMIAAGKQLALIHQVPVEGFGAIQRDWTEPGTKLQGEMASMHTYLFESLDTHLAVLLSEQILSQKEAKQIAELLQAGSRLMTRHQPQLIHGDFDDTHIFHNAGVYTGIIDFGEIEGNSPFYDLGHYRLHDGQNGMFRGFGPLLKGYQEGAALTSDDQLEIELWALWIGIKRLGRRIHKRKKDSYHEHLIQKIRWEVKEISSRL